MEREPSERPREIIAVIKKQEGKGAFARTIELNEEDVQFLMANEDLVIRQFLVRNPSTSPAQIEQLSEDEDDEVRAEVAQYGALSEKALWKLFNTRISSEILSGMAQRKWVLPKKMIEILAEDPDEMVRMYLAARQDLTPELIGRLAVDPSSAVRQLAKGAMYDGREGYYSSLEEERHHLRVPFEIRFAINEQDGGESLNQELFDEVVQWKSYAPSWVIHPKAEGAIGVRSQMKNPLYWKKANAKRWVFLDTYRISGGSTKTVEGFLDLPEKGDGFFRAVTSGVAGDIIFSDFKVPTGLMAAEGGVQRGKRIVKWKSGGEFKKGAFRKEIAGVSIQSQYPEQSDKLVEGKEPIVAKLIGTAIIEMGVYALWGDKEGPVGWTLEKSFNFQKSRELKYGDLTPAHLEPSLRMLEKSAKRLLARQMEVI